MRVLGMDVTPLTIPAVLQLLWVPLGGCLPLVTLQPESLPAAMVYLMKYGYMSAASPEARSGQLLAPTGLRDYILEFQAFAGLPQTGELDTPTVQLMNTPRCGVKDFIGRGAGARRKRYALQGSRWKVKELTYKIVKYPSTARLSTKEVDKEIEKALKVWSGVTDLTFEQRRSGKVHIDIRFESFHHGDGDPFDGVGGTLAHAFFPVYGGDAHFDDSETWTINTSKGTNLLQTAAHEFGHSLGLSHSDQFSALMAPFYRGYEKHVTLDSDDISAIQALYGRKSDKTPKPPTSPPIAFPTSTDQSTTEGKELDGGLCFDASIDSMLTDPEGDTYAFKEDLYWKLTEDAIAPGYPRSLQGGWDNLPPGVQASFSWTNGKTYFFKGSKYWRYSGRSRDKGYPKEISDGFNGIPNNLDAVFVWSGNNKIYFFKGSEYWRFDPGQTTPVKSTYPRPISNWDGVPDNIDDVIQYSNGHTYFFKKGFYYRFNDATFRISEAEPAYPRPVGYWWFGCPGSQDGDSG